MKFEIKQTKPGFYEFRIHKDGKFGKCEITQEELSQLHRSITDVCPSLTVPEDLSSAISSLYGMLHKDES